MEGDHLPAVPARRRALREILGFYSRSTGYPSTFSSWSLVRAYIFFLRSFDYLHEIFRLGGMTYIDLLHIYGVSKAGYIPQLFSLRLPNPDVILELLKKSQGTALIHDVTYLPVLRTCPIPSFIAIDAFGVTTDSSLRPYVTTPRGDDILMIFHTSGSTSGRPKLVPCSYAWWDAMISKAAMVMSPKSQSKRRQDTTTSM